MLNEIPHSLDEPSLMSLYRDQIKKASCLAEDMLLFDRLPNGHPSKNYRWLLGMVEQAIFIHKDKILVKELTSNAHNPLMTNMVPRRGKSDYHANAKITYLQLAM